MSSFCLGCGTSMAEGERFCGNCGRDSSLGAAASPVVDPAVAFGMAPDTSGKAIFSLACGILALFPPFAVVAVIFGHLSLSDIRKGAGRLAGRGLAFAGLVLGYLGIAFAAVWLTATIAFLPHRLRAARTVTNETSTVSAMRTLNTAEVAYAQAHPALGYTCSLADLSDSWGISGELAHGRKNGYVFALQNCAAAKPNGPIVRYQMVAYPAVDNAAGKPAYCSNESYVIRVVRNGSAQDCLRSGVDLPVSDLNHPRN